MKINRVYQVEHLVRQGNPLVLITVQQLQRRETDGAYRAASLRDVREDQGGTQVVTRGGGSIRICQAQVEQGAAVVHALHGELLQVLRCSDPI